MKAISPSMPATPPLRSGHGSEASAADEAFGALIAAAVGATPRPVVSHEALPKQAAPAVSSVRSSSGDDGSVRESKNSQADADKPATPGVDQTVATEDNVKPADPAVAPVAVEAPKPAVPAVPVAKRAAAPVVPGATPTVVKPAPGLGAGTAGLSAVPAGLATAAAALAHALTASAPTKPASPVLAALPVASPASALAQGQLPAQLVKLPSALAAHPAAPPAAQPGAQPAAQPAKHLAAGAVPSAVAVVAPAATNPPQVVTSRVVTPQVVDAAAAQVAPNATLVSLAGQHDAHGGKGGSQHSPSAATVLAPATNESKVPAAPTSFNQALQASNPVANVVLPAPVQQPIATAVSQAVVAPPAAQIVQVVAPLRTAKDGDYTLSLQLHPADLGPVTVRVDVHQGVLSLHMVADNAQGHDALNQGLNDLRSQLEAGGVRTGDIGLGTRSALSQQGGGQQQATHHQPADTPGGRDGGTDRRPAGTHRERVVASSNDAALDVRI